MTLGTQSSAIQDRSAVYVVPQASPTAISYPVAGPPSSSAGGALRVVSSDFGSVQTTERHGFTKLGSREFVGSTYRQIKTQEWSIEVTLAPPAAAGGIPEAHHLLRAAWGDHTVVAATSITYALATLRRHPLLSLARLANVEDRIVGEWLEGAVVTAMSLSWQGGQPPRVTFSGRARRHIAAAITALNGSMSASTSAVIAAANAVEAGARISIGTETDRLVSAVNAAGTTLTIAPSTTAADGAEVRPWMPQPAYVAAAAFGSIQGSTTLAGQTLPVTALTWEINHSSTIVEDEVASESMTDAVPGETMLQGRMTVRATEQELRRLVSRKQFATAALTMVAGAGAGRTATLNMPQIEMWVDKMALGAGAPGTIEIPFLALDAVDGTPDAATLVFT